MSGRRDPDFERELTAGLERLAPQPRGDLLQRTMRAVAETRQRDGARQTIGSGGPGMGWRRALALSAVAAVALIVGIAIGASGLLPSGDASPSAHRSGTSQPSPSAAAPGRWEEPPAYTFVMEASCGERLLNGRFRVTVQGGRTIGYEWLGEGANPVEVPVEDVPTLGQMLARVAEARAGGVADVELEADPVDGHPVQVSIDWLPEAVDDEECYAISDYAPVVEPSPSVERVEAYSAWVATDMPDPEPHVFGGEPPNAVVYFKGMFVAVGSINAGCCTGAFSPDTRAVVWLSADGRSWQLVPEDEVFTQGHMASVATDGTRLVAVGWVEHELPTGDAQPLAAIWTSLDALTWTRTESSRGPLYSVAWTSGGFRAVGARGADAGSGSVLWHGDGVRWDIELGDFGRGTLDGSYTIVREMGNGYLMAGMDGSGDATVRVSYTVEGDIDVGAIADAGAFGGGVVRDAAGSPGAWLAIGTDATGAPMVWTSADGKSWLPIVDPPFGPFAQLERVLQRPDGSFVIVGEDGVGADSLVSLWGSATGEAWYSIGMGSAEVRWSQVTDAAVTPDARLVVVAVRDDPVHHGAPVAMIAIP